MRFVCPDGEPQFREVLDEGRLERLHAAGHELAWFEPPPRDYEEWDERLRGADGLLIMWSLPPGLLFTHRSVRVVSFAGTGVESYIDMQEARGCGVAVCNVPSYGANAIAEHAFALALAVARRVAEGDRLVRAGAWGPGQTSGLELRGRRLGVVGAGPIGARAVEIGRALGMEPIVWTRSPSSERAELLGVPFVSLEALFRTADVVTLHLAHVPETEGIIDRRLLSLLAAHSILINTARAQLVDMEALLELLQAGAIFGAGLDAFDAEPLPADHPLLALDRVVLTPHVGFNTPAATAELLRVALENLLAFANGEPRNMR
jgi:phosphoglycerate dehydrogenase-like enzyme